MSDAAPEAHQDRDDPVPSVRPVDLRDYVDFSEDAATCVRVFTTPELALDLWCIEPQQATPVLHHEEQRITYTVIGGRSWFVTDEGEVGLDPMGSLLVPPGVVHGIDNRAPDPLIVVAVSSPPTQVPESAPVEERGEAIRRDSDRPNVLRRVADRLFGGRR
jgi:quercetin dioxygenase-like cupin family protein